MMMSVDNLIKKGFVAKDKRAELERYLNARGNFNNLFGGGGVSWEEKVRSGIAEPVLGAAHSAEGLREEIESIKERALPPLRILFETDIHRLEILESLFREAEQALNMKAVTRAVSEAEQVVTSLHEEMNKLRRSI